MSKKLGRRAPHGAWWRIGLLAAVLALSMWLGLRFGSAHMSTDAFLGGLFGREGYEIQRVVLYAVRLPRVLAGVVVGTGLGLSGLLLQAVTDNALAAPNIIGVNAGAGLAIVLMLFFVPAADALTPLFAFVGAFLTALVILALAHRAGGGKSAIVLAGVAMTALLGAGISCFTYADADLLSSYHAFSIGGFGGVTLAVLAVPAAAITLCAAACFLLGNRIDLLCLGETGAASLGVRVRALRLGCVLLASALAACAVSVAGLLGFVGLIVPHVSRRFCRTGTRWQTLCTALLGANVCVLGDLVGRVVASPTEIPVGIVMALVGAPFFLVLLLRRGRML